MIPYIHIASSAFKNIKVNTPTASTTSENRVVIRVVEESTESFESLNTTVRFLLLNLTHACCLSRSRSFG